jgi:acyl-CoA synthetase (AMP-forming)/AMP-acid ligase II
MKRVGKMAKLTTLNDCFTAFIQQSDPRKPVMYCNDQKVTTVDLVEQVDRYTRHLDRLGVTLGVGVGYTMPNCPELFYLLLAVSRLGGFTVPLYHLFPDAGKVNIFKNSRVQLVVTAAAQASSLRMVSKSAGVSYKIATIDDCTDADYCFTIPVDSGFDLLDSLPADTDPNLPFMVASSSGTTGIPKLVMMNQANVGAVVLASMDMVLPVDMNGKDTFTSVMAFPLSTSGILVCTGTMFAGVTLVFSEDLSPVKYLQMMNQYKADSLSAPPAYFEALLGLPMLENFNRATVRQIYTGMDFLSPSLLQRLKEKFVNITGATSGYGLIETSTVFMHSKVSNEAELSRPLNVMRLVDDIGNQIEVRDENGYVVASGETGELYVKGTSVVQGYLGNPEETVNSFRDGWFRTGDVVRNDGPTTITLLGRKKYLIKRGGKSVSPILVQNLINTLEGVKDSAVVGVPHPLYGEMIWAFIVKSTGSNIELKDIMRHCRAELANDMVPDQVTFIPEIPKNLGVGKVNYEKLRQMASQELQSIQGGTINEGTI